MPPKSKHVEVNLDTDRDELAVLLYKELNKGGKSSYYLDEENNPSYVTEYVSTGSTLLDLAVSNKRNGGLPVGRFVELSGLEGTGKSLICAQIISETQRRGGLSVFFDSERAIDQNFWIALGVNLKNVNYVPFFTLEELFKKMEQCIGSFRKNSKDRLLTIFVDSIAQSSTDTEMESEHGVDGYNTSKSIIIGKALRKITGLISDQRILVVFTNQVRYNMNAGPFGEKWITPGGKSLPFACSVRIRLANMGKIKNSKKDVIGMSCAAQIIKNRCGPNYRTAEFDIMYDSGIQDISSWLDYLMTHSLIKGDKKSGFTYKNSAGIEIEFNSKKFVELINTDLSFKEEIYNLICDNYIMKYKNINSQIIDDMEKTNSENDDISEKAVKDE